MRTRASWVLRMGLGVDALMKREVAGPVPSLMSTGEESGRGLGMGVWGLRRDKSPTDCAHCRGHGDGAMTGLERSPGF